MLFTATSLELKSASASQLHNRRYSERSRSIDGERGQLSIGGLFGERRTSLRSRQSSIVDSSGGSGHHRASDALLLDTDIPAIRLERVADRVSIFLNKIIIVVENFSNDLESALLDTDYRTPVCSK